MFHYEGRGAGGSRTSAGHPGKEEMSAQDGAAPTLILKALPRRSVARFLMRRRAGILLVTALCVLGQSARDIYRGAYRSWREAEPALERDAGTVGDALAA